MGKISKTLALFLTLALLMSCPTLLDVKPTNAQTTPKPSVPAFTLKLVDNSYDVPPLPATTPSYTTDPYTGKQIIQNPGSTAVPGYHVENITIELSIKNQPFTPQFLYGTNTSLYYNIQVKGHYETDNWVEVYGSETYGNNQTFYDYPAQSTSEYTILQVASHYQDGSKVDFRVQAIIANVTEIITSTNFLPDNGLRYHAPSDYTTGLVWTSAYPSDWSNIETISIQDGSSNPTGSLTPIQSATPTAPEFPFIIVMTIILAAMPFAVLVFKRKIH